MKGVSVQLFDETGAAYASGTNIAVMWFDSELPPDLGMIKGQSAIATTDASGYLSLDLDNVTGLAVGEFGFLVCYKLDGGDHRNSPTFVSRMEVTSMTGVTKLGPLTDYVHNPDWPAQVAMVNGVQKFTGLLAVFDHDSNFVALQTSGNYTVNWGDGSGDINVNAGVQAERNISYASVGGTIVGTSKAVAVTFTDTGDTVNRTAHGYQNGQRVNFASIVSTTGISTHTTYFVVGRTANTFQVASTLGGSALPLTTDGSGAVYIPEYKVALVTVTPQAGQNLTGFSLQRIHTQAGLQAYASPWLDIAINGSLLATLAISALSPTVHVNQLREASLGENAIADFSFMFNDCGGLEKVQINSTTAGTAFNSMFYGCGRLKSVPLIDTSLCTNFNYMFTFCRLLQAVPLLNMSSALSVVSMFSGTSLQSVPLFNTSNVTNFSYLFSNCNSLKKVPVLDTSSGLDFSYMFYSCYSLETAPAIDTSSGTTCDSMFYACSSLLEIPPLDLGAATNLSNMFSSCTALVSVPQLNTVSCTTFTGMFSYCDNIKHVEKLNTSLATQTGEMFTGCGALQALPNLNMSLVTGNFQMLWNCKSLSKARFEGTTQSIVYQNCRLSAAELNDIYTGLATVTSKTITVTGNYGTTGDDPTIATAKGWTVTG